LARCTAWPIALAARTRKARSAASKLRGPVEADHAHPAHPRHAPYRNHRQGDRAGRAHRLHRLREAAAQLGRLGEEQRVSGGRGGADRAVLADAHPADPEVPALQDDLGGLARVRHQQAAGAEGGQRGGDREVQFEQRSRARQARGDLLHPGGDRGPAQRLELGGPALGHVADDAHHPARRAAARIRDHPAAALQRAYPPVRQLHAVFEGVVAHRGEQRVEHLEQIGHVLLGHLGEEVLEALGGVGRQAVQLEGLPVADDLAGAQQPVVEARGGVEAAGREAELVPASVAVVARPGGFLGPTADRALPVLRALDRPRAAVRGSVASPPGPRAARGPLADGVIDRLLVFR
jgi:hypothetical protein